MNDKVAKKLRREIFGKDDWNLPRHYDKDEKGTVTVTGLRKDYKELKKAYKEYINDSIK